MSGRLIAGSGVDEGDGVVACDDGEAVGMVACPFLLEGVALPTAAG